MAKAMKQFHRQRDRQTGRQTDKAERITTATFTKCWVLKSKVRAEPRGSRDVADLRTAIAGAQNIALLVRKVYTKVTKFYEAYSFKKRGWSSPRSEAKASGLFQSAVTTSSSYVPSVICFIVECGVAFSLRYARAMSVFDIWASCSPDRLYLCVKFRFHRTLYRLS